MFTRKLNFEQLRVNHKLLFFIAVREHNNFQLAFVLIYHILRTHTCYLLAIIQLHLSQIRAMLAQYMKDSISQVLTTRHT